MGNFGGDILGIMNAGSREKLGSYDGLSIKLKRWKVNLVIEKRESIN